MARYKCSICGYIFDEEEQGSSFADLQECPVCHQPAAVFSLVEEAGKPAVEQGETQSLDYPREYVREDESCRYMAEIHKMAVTGKPISASMATELPMPSWDEILILGA